MTLTNRLIKIFLFSSTLLGSSFSVVKSYETLKSRSEPTHATPHINNLIRNGLGQLNKDERDKLDEIGLRIIGNRITTMDPVLDHTYDTEHFRFFYENVGYPISLSRGAYWLARSYEALRDTVTANKYYKIASEFPTTYYGQLSHLKLFKNEEYILPKSIEVDKELSLIHI